MSFARVLRASRRLFHRSVAGLVRRDALGRALGGAAATLDALALIDRREVALDRDGLGRADLGAHATADAPGAAHVAHHRALPVRRARHDHVRAPWDERQHGLRTVRDAHATAYARVQIDLRQAVRAHGDRPERADLRARAEPDAAEGALVGRAPRHDRGRATVEDAVVDGRARGGLERALALQECPHRHGGPGLDAHDLGHASGHRRAAHRAEAGGRAVLHDARGVAVAARVAAPAAVRARQRRADQPDALVLMDVEHDGGDGQEDAERAPHDAHQREGIDEDMQDIHSSPSLT